MRSAGVLISAASCCLLACVAIAIAAPSKGGKHVRCAGKPASVVGTHKADKIRLGGRQGRVAVTLGGKDTIIGSTKRDLICSGLGEDRIVARGGADRIEGSAGADTIAAGSGDDVVVAGSGLDHVAGGGGDDTLSGAKEADVLSGGDGDDEILAGGAKDTASGGRGNDLLVGARGNDFLSGGGGVDSVLGQVGDDRLRGGGDADVIIGEDGTDRSEGADGDDRIDGGAGPDQIDSGGGADVVEGGAGGDNVNSGDGADLLIGAGGGESMFGGAGPDRIYGGLVDDHLEGGPGDDLLVGGHGVDGLHGDTGDDWMRGDTNRDFHHGDAGSDTVSYATATPPGPYGLDGVTANLVAKQGLEDEPQPVVEDDEPEERLQDVENLVGSNYDDVLTGTNAGTARGLGGFELCSGFLSDDCGGGPTPNVTLDGGGIDPGLLVNGGPGDQADVLALSATVDTYVVTANVPLTAGPGCANNSPGVVSCAKPAQALGYVTAWGGDGPDHLSLAQGFPARASVILDGGRGNDTIRGSSGDEILFAGPDGADDLDGREGDDALFSGPGPDTLDGGDGNDQLVTTDPCGGHDFKGGAGTGDIAGFAQSINQGIEATLGGTAVGRSQSPCPPTRVRSDNEVLEGTQHGDVLIGNNKDNALILGNEGDDVLIGKGGADVLRGERGQDSLYGGGGADLLEALDGRRDIALFCGPGGNEVLRDRFDPPGAGCTDPKKRGKRKGTKKR